MRGEWIQTGVRTLAYFPRGFNFSRHPVRLPLLQANCGVKDPRTTNFNHVVLAGQCWRKGAIWCISGHAFSDGLVNRGDTVGHHESHFLHRSVGADCNCDHRRHVALLQINPGNAETPAAASLPLQRNRTASSRANASHTIVTRSSIAAIGLSKTAAIPTSSSPVPSPVPSMAAPFLYLASEVRAQITMTIVTPNRSIYMLRRWVVFVLWSVAAPTLSVPVRSNALTETEAI